MPGGYELSLVLERAGAAAAGFEHHPHVPIRGRSRPESVWTLPHSP